MKVWIVTHLFMMYEGSLGRTVEIFSTKNSAENFYNDLERQLRNYYDEQYKENYDEENCTYEKDQSVKFVVKSYIWDELYIEEKEVK